MPGIDRQDWQGRDLDDIANPDEPVFVIRAQDIVSGDAVRAWADLAEKAGARRDIVESARRHAQRMDDYRPKKVPDMPDNKTVDRNALET